MLSDGYGRVTIAQTDSHLSVEEADGGPHGGGFEVSLDPGHGETPDGGVYFHISSGEGTGYTLCLTPQEAAVVGVAILVFVHRLQTKRGVTCPSASDPLTSPPPSGRR